MAAYKSLGLFLLLYTKCSLIAPALKSINNSAAELPLEKQIDQRSLFEVTGNNNNAARILPSVKNNPASFLQKWRWLKWGIQSFIQKKNKDRAKNINRLAIISLLFSVIGLIVMVAFFTVSYYSFIGIGLCLIGFILSNITFRKQKKFPGLLRKRNETINYIAYFIGFLGIILAIVIGLLIWIIGTIAGGVAGVLVQ